MSPDVSGNEADKLKLDVGETELAAYIQLPSFTVADEL